MSLLWRKAVAAWMRGRLVDKERWGNQPAGTRPYVFISQLEAFCAACFGFLVRMVSGFMMLQQDARIYAQGWIAVR